jgi:aspartate kinase
MLISVGERISMTLLAMVLFERGCKAISLTGSQAGIITCSNHTDAKVLSVKPNRIIPFLDLGNIVIVAGFQGVSSLGEVTTLGRGGSDTTAVALAIALNALRVEFYKDVKGVFTGDPKKDDSVRHLPTLSYDEALNIVENSERKVLHPRALELASRNNIPLFVSSFEEEGLGTSIQDEGAKRNLDPIYEVIECPV